MLKSDSNISREKDYFNSAGQDVANSMMSLLLPQAVPLLRINSTDEKFTLIPSGILKTKMDVFWMYHHPVKIPIGAILLFLDYLFSISGIDQYITPQELLM